MDSRRQNEAQRCLPETIHYLYPRITTRWFFLAPWLCVQCINSIMPKGRIISMNALIFRSLTGDLDHDHIGGHIDDAPRKISVSSRISLQRPLDVATLMSIRSRST